MSFGNREIREKEKESDTYTHSLFCSHIAHALSFSFFFYLSYENTESKYALFVQELTDKADWDIKVRFAGLPKGTEGGKSSSNTPKIRLISTIQCMALVAPY